jgi:hypothetical protein
LEVWKQWGKDGGFKSEPDFPVALEAFRQAVERGDPRPVEMQWMLEMSERVLKRIPAVTEKEYAELAAWYRRNASMLSDINIRYWLIDGGSRRTGATEIVEKLRVLRANHPELQ